MTRAEGGGVNHWPATREKREGYHHAKSLSQTLITLPREPSRHTPQPPCSSSQ